MTTLTQFKCVLTFCGSIFMDICHKLSLELCSLNIHTLGADYFRNMQLNFRSANPLKLGAILFFVSICFV